MSCKFYSSPRWSGEILDCSMPLTFDTYDKCSFNCLYCFSYFQKCHSLNKRYDKGVVLDFNYQAMQPASVNPDKIRRIFTRTEKGHASQFNEYIRQKIAIQWGGLADPFDEYERKLGITLELLEFFNEIKYPICFSTKGVFWTKDERYLKQFRAAGDRWNVKFSIIALDPAKSKLMEKGCPSPQERLEAMRIISKLNKGEVTLRLRPFIVGFSNAEDDYLSLIRKAKEYGATAVSTEFFCLEGRADERVLDRYKEMSKIIGFDIYELYKKYSVSAGYYRLNYETKRPFMEKMEALCKKIGLRFYVSDAHHKERCANGSCCGLGKRWNYSRAQFTEALMLAKQNGKVEFSEISDGLAMFKTFRWRNAEGFNTGGTMKREQYNHWTMYDYIRHHWNTPNSLKSPYKYFGGVMFPIGLDKNKDVIYEYRGR